MTAGGTNRRAGVRALLSALVAAGALTAATLTTAAEPGEATTFGADGIAVAGLGSNYLRTGIATITARADGGFVAQRDDRLESFLADGAPDPAAPAVALPKGRKVFPAAAGKSLVLEEGEKLTRLNPDGTPDPSFGGTRKIESEYIGIDQVIELGSGKIAAVGTAIEGARRSAGYLAVTVLNPDGSVDKEAGVRQRELSLERNVELRELVPMADGGALVVDESFLLELNADGTVNTAFGKEGIAYEATLASAHFLADGSIEAVGGSYGEGTGQDLAVFRFTPAGTPDAAFGVKGIRKFDLGGEETANVATWAADGSVVVAGNQETHYPCPGEDCELVPILAEFSAAGDLEAGFGEGGVLRLSALAGPSALLDEFGGTALARRADGSLLVAGNAAPEGTVAFVAGVTSTGQLIPTFGEGGIVRLRSPVAAGQALTGIAAVRGGGLIAVGTTEMNVEETPVLIRYTADGSLDPAFAGGAGYLTLGESGRAPIGLAVHDEEALTSMRGKPRGHLLMFRTTDGTPVSSFGSGGSVALPKGVKVTALTFAPDGGPLVLAVDKSAGNEVLRYRPDGTLDKSFGRGGAVRLRLPGGFEVGGASIAVGAHGSIVIAGKSGSRFALGSLRSDGRPNPHFGKGGWALAKGVDGLPAEYELATPAPDGSRIYLAGCAGDESSNRIVLMRFDGRGRLDRGFGHKGRITTTYSRGALPTLIAPGPHAVHVVLDIGPLPLLTFFPNGKVKREAPGAQTEFVRYVRGAVAGGKLLLGWSHPVTETLTERSYISERPLRP